MKHIFPKVEVHPLFYFFALLSILTAHFRPFLEVLAIILFHELGHIIASILCKWKIKRVLILPLGGMTEFQEKLNKPIHQELFILVMGPLFQMLFYLFYPTVYHYPLLFFNLLPIYPLDGSKFLFLFWNVLGSYYYSYWILFFCSYLSVIFILIFYHNLFFLLMCIYLLWKTIYFYREIPLYFSIFLFERYQKEYPYYRKKVIVGNKVKKMKRSTKHYFVIQNELLEEKSFLASLFNLTNNKRRV